MLTFPRWALLLGILLLKGCTVETTKPLADPLTANVDESLFGHWVGEIKNEERTSKVHVFVGKLAVEGNPKSIMEASMVVWTPEDRKVECDSLFFTVTTIEKSSYVSFLDQNRNPKFSLSEAGTYAKWLQDEKRICHIARYQCDKNQLQIWVAKDIKKVKLSADRNQAADDLSRYLKEEGGEKLFDEVLLTLTRAD